MTAKVEVLVEVAAKRSFASAADWPGWSRGAKSADDAVAALLAYAPRYARVAKRAGVTFSPPRMQGDLKITERLHGDAGTEYGIPSTSAEADDRKLSTTDLDRQVALLRAAWKEFDAAARAAQGVTLTTGPRGGGRSLEKIVVHVAEAEDAYLSKLGSRPPKDARDEAARREFMLESLAAVARGEEPPNANNTRKRWTPRFFLRRAAWHVLDHAWEIEDRSAGGR
jgi:hypothetical protein